MNEVTNIEQNQENIDIENMIYEIRGKQVMLDSEVAITKCYKLFIKKGMINNE